MHSIITIVGIWQARLANCTSHFDGVASVLMRLILGPVLILAGWEKLTGENWFAFSQEPFPFPFDVLPAGVSWALASWTEFVAGSIVKLNNGVEFAGTCLAMLMALMVIGGGRYLSLDYYLGLATRRRAA